MKKISSKISFSLVIFLIVTQVLYIDVKSATTSFKQYKVQIIANYLNIRSSASTSAKIVGKYTKGTVVTVIGKSGSFLKTSKGYIYNSPNYLKTVSTNSGASFKQYKVQVIANYIYIRSSASTSAKIVGKYTKGTVVTVTGKSGSFLKTSKGYIYNSSSYIKNYIQSTSTFTSYKAVVTASTLNIRQAPSTTAAIVGKYYKGNIIAIIGKSGTFLKTNKGYVSSQYVAKYTPSREENPLVGRFIRLKEDVTMFKTLDGTLDDRLLLANESFKILGIEGDFYKIIKGSSIGYVHKDKVDLLDNIPNDKFTLAWQYIYDKSRNSRTYDEDTDYINIKSSQTGLDVVSPTWFDMTGDYRNVSSIDVIDNADPEYIKRAHNNGYEVWPRFVEFDADRAYAMFTNATVRKKVISKVVSLARSYNVDGINIDFEALGTISANKDLFTAFVRDLSAELKKYNMVVSVDVVRISTSQTWSKWYDRQALINYVDYMILMAYDEHVASSTTAGSVGSYPWVKDSIEELIEIGIPKEKLVLGVPFYLRLYKLKVVNNPYDSVVFTKANYYVYSSNSTSSTKLQPANIGDSYKLLGESSNWYKVEFNGGIGYIPMTVSIKVPANTIKEFVVSSSAISTNTAMNYMQQYGGRMFFDSKAQQNVVTYNADGYKYIVWLEDNTSMGWRMDLANQFDLPGIGAWSLGWEDRSIWDVIKEKIK
ncbi:putative sporulation-specific glycosylase YdhD [Caloramator mitchellensis]|uniref:Putative sporulation-specific glycosylase YdhD n=1 Tax=Caloramator mitchellensis TaxID=908809 RepID=A0A0R3JVS9_CALMK|nr:SH3 domain-containing protein [Caloramator mitchellensis]KRQ87655.1 putative sporulation-specific glycosylase YdhD [Caloramator mitchellensis]